MNREHYRVAQTPQMFRYKILYDAISRMLDNQEISEQLRLAANIIFRAKLVLEEMQETPSVNNVVHNTMLMMDLLELANIKGYIPANSSVNFNKLFFSFP